MDRYEELIRALKDECSSLESSLETGKTGYRTGAFYENQF